MLNPHARRTVLVGLAGVCLAITITLVLLSSGSRIRILDRRFEVISVTTTRGTNQVIYFDDQLVGRVKEALGKLGLGVRPVTKLTVKEFDERNLRVSVIYRGAFTQQELTDLEAELTNRAGKLFKLYQGYGLPDPNSNNYLGTWLVDFTSRRLQSTNKPNYTLRLRLPNGGPQLAEIKLGTLRK